MIYETLTCFADELNEYFRTKIKTTEDKVVISSLVNQDGSVAVPGENKIVITLLNLEREPTAKNTNGNLSGKSFSSSSTPSLAINLQIFCSAYFVGNNYTEGLKFLSLIISFLQQKPVFTIANTPRLHNDIKKLMFEMETVGLERLNNIWAMLGAKCMPSVLYKVRMLVFDSDTNIEYRPVINGMAGDNRVLN